MRLALALLLLLPTILQAQQSDRIYREGFERPCNFLPAPLKGALPIPYEQYAGVPFGVRHDPWAWGNTSNIYNIDTLLSINVKSYVFQAPPEGQSLKLKFPSSIGGIAASISNQCGSFDVPSRCMGFASGAITWSTESTAPSNRCNLIPGSTYYLNFAWFNYPNYLNNLPITSTCSCPGINCVCYGSSCTATCQYGNNMTTP